MAPAGALRTMWNPSSRITAKFALLGALAGFVLPLAGETIHGMLLELGYAFAVNYWHFAVAPVLGAAAGYTFARATRKRREADRARTARSEEVTALFDTLRTGLYKTELDGRLIFASRGLSDLFGYDSPAELMSGPVQRLWAHPEDRRAFLEELGKTGSLYDWRVRLRKRNGESFAATITAHLRAGQILGVVSQADPARHRRIIDICSSCDRARTASGEWQKLSAHIIENMEDLKRPGGVVLFSHGICPQCADELYGDLMKW